MTGGQTVAPERISELTNDIFVMISNIKMILKLVKCILTCSHPGKQLHFYLTVDALISRPPRGFEI